MRRFYAWVPVKETGMSELKVSNVGKAAGESTAMQPGGSFLSRTGRRPVGLEERMIEDRLGLNQAIR